MRGLFHVKPSRTRVRMVASPVFERAQLVEK